MSEKYSTDELIGYLENVGFTPPDSIYNLVIARLRAADKLHDAVLESYRWRVSLEITPYDIMSCLLRDAMRRYEGKE